VAFLGHNQPMFFFAMFAAARLGAIFAPLNFRLTGLWTASLAPAAEPVSALGDDVAMITYTSGATGRPKGAMLTHGNFWWNNANAMHSLDCLADDVTLATAPVFHIGGLNVTRLMAFQKGALVVLHRTFDPGRALADIPANKVTTMFGVPAMFLNSLRRKSRLRSGGFWVTDPATPP
jgi:fatty-acyl-CoA synthase